MSCSIRTPGFCCRRHSGGSEATGDPFQAEERHFPHWSSKLLTGRKIRAVESPASALTAAAAGSCLVNGVRTIPHGLGEVILRASVRPHGLLG